MGCKTVRMTVRLATLIAILLIAERASGAPPTPHERFADPFSYCAAVGSIDMPDARYAGPAMPESVARGLQKAFEVPADRPVEPFAINSIWRCMNGKVYACSFGANLPCTAKASTDRKPTRAIVGYCQEEPDADFVPVVVTGRETIYEWFCRGALPVIKKAFTQPDARGFLSNIWFEIPATE